MVRVADTAMRMQLPAGVTTGDTLDMTLIGIEPRPTFLLGKPGADENTSLSNAGQLIDRMLQTAAKNNATTALVGRTPLVASANVPTPQVAVALQDALTFSGLFYESHLQQWASGERSLDDVMREPQAKNHPPAMTHAESASMTKADAAQKVLLLQDGTANTSAASGNKGDANAASATLVQGSQDAPDVEAAKMINLQLDALEQRRIQWQGELWPGQPMEWEVRDDTSRDHPGEAKQQWQSTVRFELPNLGTVSATIHLTDSHVQIHVRAASEAAAVSLRTNGNTLADAMETAGSRLDLLTVKHDDSV